MELKLISVEKNSLEFIMLGEKHTFPNLLKSRLLNDTDVTFVSYKLEHPMNDECSFIVKAKTKDPKKVLLDACKSIEDDLDEFKNKVKKALK